MGAARASFTPKNRYLNAANSPYTFVLKYYKLEADNKAHITHGDLWPQFNAVGAVDGTSLAIKWKAKDCSRLQSGLLEVYDGKNNCVVEGSAGQRFHGRRSSVRLEHLGFVKRLRGYTAEHAVRCSDPRPHFDGRTEWRRRRQHAV
jgi:hypothetical protein